MRRWEETIEISAPADRVFDYVSDMQRHSEWGGHGLQASKVGDGPTAVGTKYATTAKQFGTQREQSTVTDLDRPSTFAWDSVGALGRVHHWFAIEGAGEAATVRKGAEVAAPTFLAKLTMFKLSKDIPGGLRRDLANIKTNLER